MGRQDIAAELHAVAALVPTQVVRELESLFARIVTGIIGGRTQVCLARNRDSNRSRFRRNQRRVHVVKQTVLEPSKTRFVHNRAGGNAGPCESGIPRTHGGIGIVSNAVTVREYSLGLNSVWRNPPQIVKAGAH